MSGFSNMENIFEPLIIHYHFKQTPCALSVKHLQYNTEILKHKRVNFVFLINFGFNGC